jgi:hypothetical protein
MKVDFDPTDSRYTDKIDRRLEKTSIVDFFTPPEGDDVVIMGTYSRTWRNKPYREIMKGKTVSIEGRSDSATAHTRDYLSYCYSRRPAKGEQRDLLKPKRMPLYSLPCIIQDAVYLDIKSAWFSIVNLVGWNVEYWPSLFLGRGQPPRDFQMPDNKVARSALVTIGRTTALPMWDKGKMIYRKMFNATENYHIWGVISDVLNAIAAYALRCGARYINTDGFILKRANSAALMAYIENWGLEARYKHEGTALICGPGSYVIGPHATARNMNFTACDYVDRSVNAAFLGPRVVRGGMG